MAKESTGHRQRRDGFSESTGSRVRRYILRGLAVAAIALVLTLGYALSVAWVPMGKMASGQRLQRMRASEHFDDDHFLDLMPRNEPNILKILPKWFETPVPFRRPEVRLPIASNQKSLSAPPSSGLRVTWLGHSTLIVELEGTRILIDPVWGDYVAPLDVNNAKRFAPPPLPLEQLPPIDAVVISHDHYDHLDYPTIVRLSKTSVPFYVPLGVGAHLAYWGVAESRIFEHDWWDESPLSDSVTLVCSPARHFSGRSLVDKDHTLWAGWAILGRSKRVYYSGDTALFPGFAEIGKRLGPFDLTMIESGAYNQMWADVHLGPEQAIVAHTLLRGKRLFPVHWGMFDLGLHGWTEPIERIAIAASRAGVEWITVPPGGSFEPDSPPAFSKWWPERPFQTVEEAPAFSSGVEALLTNR